MEWLLENPLTINGAMVLMISTLALAFSRTLKSTTDTLSSLRESITRDEVFEDRIRDDFLARAQKQDDKIQAQDEKIEKLTDSYHDMLHKYAETIEQKAEMALMIERGRASHDDALKALASEKKARETMDQQIKEYRDRARADSRMIADQERNISVLQQKLESVENRLQVVEGELEQFQFAYSQEKRMRLEAEQDRDNAQKKVLELENEKHLLEKDKVQLEARIALLETKITELEIRLEEAA